MCGFCGCAGRSQCVRIRLHCFAVCTGWHTSKPSLTVFFLLLHSCNGDTREAQRRWDITRHWREAEGINDILKEPQPHFSLIKSMYPHYNCGRGKEGHVIFWERAGEFQAPQLAARGVRIEELVRHWLFCTEYQWQILCEGDETAKSIAVLDAKGTLAV
jgi:hypothetical protein